MSDTEQRPPTLPRERRCPFSPPPELEERRQADPVSRMRFADDSEGWLLTRHADVRAALATPHVSSHPAKAPQPWRNLAPEMKAEVYLPGFLIFMDPPDHTRYRRLLTKWFTMRAIRRMQPRVDRIVADALDAMEAQGGPVDLVQSFALPIPLYVICELMGVRYEDRADFMDMVLRLQALDASPEELGATGARMNEFMMNLAADKRKNPGEDLLSHLAHDPDANPALTDLEIAGIGVLMLIAGHETSANMLGVGTYTLLRNPDQWALLRDDIGLIDQAVEELLRHQTIVQQGLPRGVTEDMEIGGHPVKAGEAVLASLPAANRDPEVFPDPDRLDITREHNPHLAFGHGIHLCLGMELARVEMRSAWRGLVTRFPTLRMAAPPEDIRWRDDQIVYGVYNLPVTWDDAR
ncbi:cytochrome P450 [Streptomyces sp. NPDC046887]|uniref:cytochrome P450 n=1 Tax=Streptomyces sp. NPDC046887 TaxID=3155472 RepID=UPI0033E03D6B